MKDNAIKWLISVPGRKKGYIAALLVVQGALGLSGVFYALLLRTIVDAAAGGDRPGFWTGIFGILLLVATQIALRAIVRWLSEFSRASFENVFKGRLMNVLIRKDYLTVSAVHSGEWMNRLTNDSVVVANGCVEILPGIVEMVIKLIGAVVMIVLLEPWFAAVLVPGGLILTLTTWLFRKKMKQLHKVVQEADGRFRIFLQDRIGSMLMVHSYVAEDRTEQETREKMKDHKKVRMQRNAFSNFCNIGFAGAMNGMYLLGVGWCGYGILTGTITFGTMTALTQLVSQIQAPFANITGYLPRYFAMIASAERLMAAEAFEDGFREEPYAFEQVKDFYAHRLRSFGLKKADFAYYPAAEGVEGLSREGVAVAIEDISIDIKKGEYVAFTGTSGCGKSTVLKLLMCVYRPDAGERYYVDDDGERAELSSRWRRLFAYVPQGNHLMSGTIREIVTFADPGASRSEERLSAALQIACADSFVRELEQGVDTLLGERGTGLSEGQLQRIAIARAVFSESPILLLDEATSALDAGTEKAVLENLRHMTDRTVIIVTHRPAVLDICNRVVEFTDKGVCERSGG